MVCVGVDHATAPLASRERLARALSRGDAAIGSLATPLAADCEYAWLTTCNRVEVYAILAGGSAATGQWVDLAAEWMTAAAGAVSDTRWVRRFIGDEAERHLCRVASGLESMVLGEAEILGQVAQAIERARLSGTAGEALQLRFDTALRVGRRARAETSLGHHPASIGSIAVRTAEEWARERTGNRALVIGVGKVGRAGAARLHASGRWTVRAARRATPTLDGVPPLDGVEMVAPGQLAHAIAWTDVVFAAAGVQEVVVGRDLVHAAMAARDGRPLLVIDVGVPRNVEATVRDLPGVTLVDLDDLTSRATHARECRRLAIPRVECIIDEELEDLARRTRGADLLRLVHTWRQESEQVRRRALDEVVGTGNTVPAEVAEQLERLSVTLVSRLLDAPTRRLRQEAGNGHAKAYEAMVRRLLLGAEEAAPPVT